MDEPRSEPSPKPAAGASRGGAARPRGGAAAPAGGRARRGRAGGADRRADRRRRVGRRPFPPTGDRVDRGRVPRARSSGWRVTARSSFAAEQRADENAAINKTLSYTPAVRMAGSQHRELALTFDDGPGPYTLRLLRVLRRMHTPATFFEVGVGLQYFHAGTVGDRQARLSDRRSHLEPSRHGRAVTRPAAGPAAAAGARDRPLRRAVPADVPPALRRLERDHAAAAAQGPHADGAVVARHRRLAAAGRPRRSSTGC